jgi:hypothetical protein
LSKSRKKSTTVIPAKAGIQERADELLAGIRRKQEAIEVITMFANDEIEQIKQRYEGECGPFKANLLIQEKALIALMKKERAIFFDGTDVLQLTNGALIHEVGDKVSIPRDALSKCKELKFNDVIKVAESLDREAIEKWKDEKLLLIGAERKPTETFSYDLKKTADCHSREGGNPDESLFDVDTCRVCGCTDNTPCEGGCHWVEDDLCSACVGNPGKE